MYIVVYAVQHPEKEGVELICTRHINSKHLRGAIRQAYQEEQRQITRVIRAFEA